MAPKMREILHALVFNALRTIDVGLVMFSFGLAAVIGIKTLQWTTIADFFASKVSLSSCVLFAIAILLCYGVFSACGLYKSKRMSTNSAEVKDVLRAMTFSTLCIWLEGRLFFISVITPQFVLAFWVSGSALIISARFLLRLVLGAIRKRGHNLHHVLVLGTNPRAVEFGRKIETMPRRGYRLVGFVDDDWPGMEAFRQTRFPVVCGYSNLAEFLRCNVVDEIALYLPLRSFYERAAFIAQLARQHGILLRCDTDIFDLRKFSHLQSEAQDGSAQIVPNAGRIDGWPLVFKRLFDMFGSLLLLLALSPLFLVVALLIKLSSRGPVFFAQERMGLNKREFRMFKFRTMIPNAESVQEELAHLNEMSGPVFKIKNDPRITPVGRILRKTSIDELPQLFNVLTGDMSLVGPRAMSVRDYRLFSEDWQRRRFSIRPGITCLWQVQGRNAIPFEQWMRLDMQYIDGWSLWLDVKILALTIPAVFRGVGAG
jgi:exopolysaccharide biosynthesis polyprenyl glycosylphosphotransferase